MTDSTQDSNTTDAAVETPKATPVHVNFDNKLDYKAAKFSFRTVKDKETGVETKRATIELDKIPTPSVEGIVAILETGGKALDLLLEAVQEVVFERVRDVINSNEALTSETFDYASCDWNVIANLEKEDRRSGISKETWEEFSANYIEVMPAVSNTTKEQCTNAAKIFAAKFAPIKSKKDVIQKLTVRLAMYAEHSPKAAEFADCIEFLFNKAKKLIEAKEVSLEENLGF